MPEDKWFNGGWLEHLNVALPNVNIWGLPSGSKYADWSLTAITSSTVMKNAGVLLSTAELMMLENATHIENWGKHFYILKKVTDSNWLSLCDGAIRELYKKIPNLDSNKRSKNTSGEGELSKVLHIFEDAIEAETMLNLKQI